MTPDAINAANLNLRITNMQMILKIACLIAALTLTACSPSRGPGGATERTLCRVWGESLPTRSRADTAQTQTEIAESYADFVAACPGMAGLVP